MQLLSIFKQRWAGALIVLGLCRSLTFAGGSGSQNTLTALTNTTVCPGSSVTFSTTAGGPTPYRFEWWKNGVVIPGKTTNTLSLTNVSSSDTATYSVKLTGGHNSVTNSATLTVRTLITASPLTNLVRAIGANAVFSPVVSGTGPLSYVWQKNGTNISGQTGSSLVLTNLALKDSGTYSVIVSGPCNSVTASGTLMVDSCFPSVDVMLVIDRSGSMQGKPYNDARLASSNFVQNLHFTTNGDLAGLASYNSIATLDQKLTNSLLALDSAIASIPAAGGNTSISLGLQTAQTELTSIRHNSNALPVLVLLSDGLPTGSDTASNVVFAATQAKNAGTRIFTVGLGAVDTNLMSGIASSPSDFFYTTNSSELTRLFNAISTVICRPPTNIVTTGPTNTTVCAGGVVTLGVSASGCDTFTFQWEKNGTRLAGKTNNTLVISNVTTNDAGVYSVEIISTCQSVTNSALLTVNENVLVTGGPDNQTNCPGTTATFQVSASGTALTYQWFKGTTLLPGRTGNSLNITNVSAADAGAYSVVVRGVCGNPMTNSAFLVVNENVVIAAGPANQTNCPGTSAHFSVSATGTGLTYQWFRGGAILEGQTGPSLTLNGVTVLDAGVYSVVVSGICGNPVTNSAALVVNENVVISTAPANQTNCPGTTASFNISASGTAIAYQWYKAGAPLASATGNSLTITNVSAVDAAIYSVVVSGTCGNPVTNSAALVVNENVVISTGPVNQTNCPGTTANFNISASGTAIAYQWYKAGAPLAGETGNSLTITNVSAVDAAIYSVVVSGTCGSPVTNSAALAVNENVVITSSPVSQTNCSGTAATFNVAATGTGIGYQWYRASNVLSGQTTASLTITNVTSSDAGIYTVVVTGTCGAITNSATLTVNAATAASPLAGAVLNLGESATFTTVADGTGPFTFVWKKNGVVIAGATTNTLTLTNVTFGDSALYSVEVTGKCNTAIQSATLVVNHPPTVSIFAPTNGAIFTAPGSFTLAANADDSDGIVTNVEFFQYTTNKIGETTNSSPATIELVNLPTGTYTFTARATDNFGAHGTSAPVSITVIQHLPLTIIAEMHLNRQTGLFEQTVRVFNPTYSSINAVRVYISNLNNNTTVYNASGSLNGVPYVESHAVVNPGSNVDLVIEYYVPSRIPPNPVLTADLVPPPQGGGTAAAGTQQHIDRGIMLPNKTFLVEFLTVSNRIYSVQYSSDLLIWKDAQPAIIGNGTRIQWIDNGEPKTESAPSVTPARFYRVVLLP